MAVSQENSATQQGGEPSGIELLELAGGPATEDARAQGAGPSAAGEAAAQAGEGAPAGSEAPVEGQPSWPEELQRYFPEIAAKFKDPVDLARSYAELERHFHLFRQAGLTPEQAYQAWLQLQAGGAEEEAGEAEETEEADAQEYLDRLAQAPRETIRSEARSEALEVVQTFMASMDVWNQLAAKHPDVAQVEERMTQLVHLVPGLLEAGFSLPEAVEHIYSLARGGAAAPSPEAVEKARQEAAAAERQRVLQQVRSATVEGGTSGGAPPTASKSPERQVIDEILAVESGRPTMTPA